jgi:hypothetical protein
MKWDVVIHWFGSLLVVGYLDALLLVGSFILKLTPVLNFHFSDWTLFASGDRLFLWTLFTRTRALFPCFPYSESFMKGNGIDVWWWSIRCSMDLDRALINSHHVLMLRYTCPNFSSYVCAEWLESFLFAVLIPSYSCRCGGHDLACSNGYRYPIDGGTVVTGWRSRRGVFGGIDGTRCSE